ncbi:MAG: hypothetical protein H6978_08610 [Gammaproteobacteria bacterium]|nr:hypothetical protein [Gammaproteobacteria bacterium]
MLLTAIASALHTAQAGELTVTGNYLLNGGSGVNLWDGGGAFNISENIFLGTSWNTSGGFGGIETGLFGDSYGLEVRASTNGTVGLDLGYHATSGLVQGQAPFSIKLNVPDIVRPGETVRLSSALDLSGLKYQTTSPDFGFRVGMKIDMFASVGGRACFVDCANFGGTLIDVDVSPELLSFNYNNTAGNIVDSYDQKVMLFRGTPAQLDVTPLIMAGMGHRFPVYSNAAGVPIITVRYGSPGQTTLFPVVQTEGVFAAGDAVIDSTGSADLISAGLSLTALGTQLGILPPLGFNLKNALGSSAPDFLTNVNVSLLDVTTGVGLGFRQDFELKTPDVMIDLQLQTAEGQVVGTATMEAGGFADITIPISLLSLGTDGLKIVPTVRFAESTFSNDTQLALTPYINILGPTLKYNNSPIIKTLNETWKLPLPGITIFENSFGVQFTGQSSGGSIVSDLSFERTPQQYATTGGELQLQGQYASKQIQADQAPSRVVTTGGSQVDLINSLLDTSAGPYLDIETALFLGARSQLAIGDIRNYSALLVTGNQAQIGASDLHTSLLNDGNIFVGFDTIAGQLTIVDATITGSGLVDIDTGPNPATPNRLELSDIDTFASQLRNRGVTTINNTEGAAPTRFEGLTNSAWVTNLGTLTIERGVVEVAAGMFQTQNGFSEVGHIQVKDRLTVEATLQDGTIGISPGGVLAVDAGGNIFNATVTGDRGAIRYGDGTIAAATITLQGGNSAAIPTLFGPVDGGVNASPELLLSGGSLTLAHGSIEVGATSTLNLDGATISFTGSAGRLNSGRGALFNAGNVVFDSVIPTVISSDRDTVNTAALPAVVNEATGTFSVNGGTAEVRGGLLNLGQLDINAEPQGALVQNVLEISAASSLAPASFNDLVTTGSLNNAGSLILNDGARLIINGGDVNFTGHLIDGDVVNNAGTFLVDARQSSSQFNGDFTQTSGTLKLGSQTIIEGTGFDINGRANLGGLLDVSVLQLGIDGLLPGFTFNLVEGETFTALTFTDYAGEFAGYVLPELTDFFWMPVYSSQSLQFRLTEFRDYPVPFANGFQFQIGVVPGAPDELVLLDAEEALIADLDGAVMVGNAVAGDGTLQLRNHAILTTGNAGLSIQATGNVDVQNSSTVRAFGDVVINGGSFGVLDDSELNLRSGVSFSAMNGAFVVLASDGFEVPDGGSLTVSSGSTMIVAGGIDFSLLGDSDLTVTGNGTVLTANALPSHWRGVSEDDVIQLTHTVTVSNGGSLNISDLEVGAKQNGSVVNITVDGAGSSITQTTDASFDMGGVDPAAGYNAFLTLTSGGQFVTGNGKLRVGSSAKVTLDGGVLDINNDLLVQNGQIYGQAAAGLQLNGHNLTAIDEAWLEFTTPYNIDNGSTFTVNSGSRLLVDGYLDIAGEGAVGDGTLVASGQAVYVTADQAESIWGANGHTANVVISEGARATFSDLSLADDTVAGSTANVVIGGERFAADTETVEATTGTLVQINSLGMTTLGGATSQAQLTLTGYATLRQADGVGPAGAVIGHASEGSANLQVLDGALYDFAATGGMTINATGSVLVDGGYLRMASGLVVNGGSITLRSPVVQGSVQPVLEFDPTKSIAVHAGGVFDSDAGLTTNGALTVTTGGQLLLGQALFAGGNAVVTGAGTQLNAAALQLSGTLQMADQADADIESVRISAATLQAPAELLMTGGATLTTGANSNLYIGYDPAYSQNGYGILALAGAGTQLEVVNGTTSIGGDSGALVIEDQAQFISSSGISPVVVEPNGAISIDGGSLSAATLSVRGNVNMLSGSINANVVNLFDTGVMDLAGGSLTTQQIQGVPDSHEGTLNINGSTPLAATTNLLVGNFNVGRSGQAASHVSTASFNADVIHVGADGALVFQNNTPGGLDTVQVDAGGTLSFIDAIPGFDSPGLMVANGAVSFTGGQMWLDTLEVGGSFTVDASGTTAYPFFNIGQVLFNDPAGVITLNAGALDSPEVRGANGSEGIINLNGGALTNAAVVIDVGEFNVGLAGSAFEHVVANDTFSAAQVRVGAVGTLRFESAISAMAVVQVDQGGSLLLNDSMPQFAPGGGMIIDGTATMAGGIAAMSNLVVGGSLTLNPGAQAPVFVTGVTTFSDPAGVIDVEDGEFWSTEVSGMEGGAGTLTLNGGQFTNANMAVDVDVFNIGLNPAKPTTHTAANTTFAAPVLHVGPAGNLELQAVAAALDAVTVDAGGVFAITESAPQFAANGSMVVNGTASITGSNLALDSLAVGGSFTVHAGTGANVIAAQTVLTYPAGAITVDGGVFSTPAVGGAMGALTLNGGQFGNSTMDVDVETFNVGLDANKSATQVFTGGTFVAPILHVGATGTLEFQAGTPQLTDVVIDNGGELVFTNVTPQFAGGNSLTLNGALSGSNATVDIVTLVVGSTANGSVAGLTLDVADTIDISGAMQVNGAAHVISRDVRIAPQALDINGVVLQGAGSNWTVGSQSAPASKLSVGENGNGTLEVGLAATINLNNARVVVGNGGTANGVMNINGGGSVTALGGHNDEVGVAGGSIGTVNVSGAGSAWNGQGLIVANSGAGTINISNAGVVNTGDATVGLNNGSVGTVDIGDATSLWNVGNLTLGAGGTGNVNAHGQGKLQVRNTMTIGQPGTLAIDGGIGTIANTLDVSGIVTVSAGGQLTSGVTVLGPTNGNNATATVTGEGSLWQLSSDLTVGGSGNGTLTLSNLGVANIAGTLNIGATGAVNLAGGELIFNTINNSGTLDFATGTLHQAVNNFTVGAGGVLGNSVTLGANQALVVDTTTVIDPAASLTINGGTLGTTGFTNNGSFSFLSGTFHQLNGDFDVITGGALGASVDLITGRTLRVDGNTVIDSGASLLLNGGSLITDDVVGSGTLQFNSGTLQLTSASVTVGTGGRFGATLQQGANAMLNIDQTITVLADGLVIVDNANLSAGSFNNLGEIVLTGPAARLQGGALSNTGLVHGDGRIETPLTNTAAGEVRVNDGDRLLFTGAGNTNAGTVNVLGGTAEFAQDFTNEAGATVNGHGTFMADGGIENQGAINFSGLISDVFGDLNHTGTVLISGTSTVNFYDDITNNGTQFRVSTGSVAAFLGSYHGGSGFQGLGTVLFDGLTNAGNSPALTTVEGNMIFGGGNMLTIDIIGTEPGSEFDRWEIGGTAHLAGTLDFDLFDFVPQAGDQFEFLVAEGGLFGSFNTVLFPELPGLAFSLSQDGRSVILNVMASPVPVPGAVWLLGSALGAMLLRRRRLGKSDVGIACVAQHAQHAPSA